MCDSSTRFLVAPTGRPRSLPFLRKSPNAGTIVLVLSLLFVPLLPMLPAAPAQADGFFFWSILISSFLQGTCERYDDGSF
jgi:hypothetical protein